jgi:hypothetical protein
VGRRPARWQPWLALGLFGFLPHFVWEILQVPLYEHMHASRHWSAVLQCSRATVGDVVITWTAYAVAAGRVQDRWWLGASHWGRPLTVFLGAGLVKTVVLEWLNVYAWRRWAYSPDMPVVLGIGLAPIVQWLLVPLVTLWLARKQLGMTVGELQ